VEIGSYSCAYDDVYSLIKADNENYKHKQTDRE